MISLFFYSLFSLFSSLDLVKRYNIMLHMMVKNVTKHDEGITYVTVTHSHVT